MNLIDLQLPNHKLYAIGVPGDSPNYSYIKVDFPFKIIGHITKEHISFDPSLFLERHFYYEGYYKDYENPTGGDDWYKHPNGSFRSLLQSKEAYFENPMGEKPDFKKDNMAYKMWYQAGGKVNPKYIIIEKI